MVAPRVPRELADEPVILMEVVPGVGEDHVRVEPALELLEHVLHLAADVGKEPVAKPVDNDLRASRRSHEGVGARPRLALPVPLGAEHDPRDLDLGARSA
jgi:hypothetical protein